MVPPGELVPQVGPLKHLVRGANNEQVESDEKIRETQATDEYREGRC